MIRLDMCLDTMAVVLHPLGRTILIVNNYCKYALKFLNIYKASKTIPEKTAS